MSARRARLRTTGQRWGMRPISARTTSTARRNSEPSPEGALRTSGQLRRRPPRPPRGRRGARLSRGARLGRPCEDAARCAHARPTSLPRHPGHARGRKTTMEFGDPRLGERELASLGRDAVPEILRELHAVGDGELGHVEISAALGLSPPTPGTYGTPERWTLASRACSSANARRVTCAPLPGLSRLLASGASG